MRRTQVTGGSDRTGVVAVGDISSRESPLDPEAGSQAVKATLQMWIPRRRGKIIISWGVWPVGKTDRRG